MKKKPWFDEDLTLDGVKRIFVEVLNETKIAASALPQDIRGERRGEGSGGVGGVKIEFAIISVPDFFNGTLCRLVLEAAGEVGIGSLERTVARTVAVGVGVGDSGSGSDSNSGVGVAGGYGKIGGGRVSGMQRITAGKAEPTSKARNLLSLPHAGAIKRAEKILVIEQGLFHAGLRTYEVFDGNLRSKSPSNPRGHSKPKGEQGEVDESGIFQQRYLPLDPYASQNIDNKLFERVVQHDGFLREVVGRTGERERGVLRDEVVRGRLLIRGGGGLEREVAFMGRGGGGGGGVKGDEKVGEGEGEGEGKEEDGEDVDKHHEEWPLSLDGVSAVLKWEDVQAVEDEYVRKLAEAVHMFLVTLRRMRTSNDLTHHPETIHIVAIQTDHTDGHLLIRAVRQALGPDVKIVGGTLGSVTLAAEGAAKLALMRLRSWEEVFREERMREFLWSMKTEMKDGKEEL
ncbi:hypothetical protein IFR05_013718 [Cadophora sp. M221]|nr:hypothetical protein IFR05_013718 [Cadophora sp. M221]